VTPIRSQITELLENFPAHSAAEKLRSEIAALNDEDLVYLGKQIDESEHSLEEWLNAVIAFNLWLEREKRELSFFDRVDYLHCCAEGGQQSGGLLTLTELFHDYVKAYGVE